MLLRFLQLPELLVHVIQSTKRGTTKFINKLVRELTMGL